MALAPGEPAPWFRADTPSLNQFSFSAAGGRYVLLLFAPSDPVRRQAAIDQVLALSRAPDDRHLSFMIVLASREPVQDRLPGMRWEHITVGPKQVLLLTFLTPIHANRTRITQLIWSDHWAFTFKRIFAPFVRAFLRQDGDMVNLQNMGLAYDPSLLWIDDADRQAKWYQQLKREWAASRKEGRPFRNPVEATTLKWRS
jgi:hypothetical protein